MFACCIVQNMNSTILIFVIHASLMHSAVRDIVYRERQYTVYLNMIIFWLL